jgi:hypothetical protein
VDSILNNTNKTTFICHIEKPLVWHKRIAVVAPPLTEHENGFDLWFIKMAKLAQELSIPILFCSNENTQNYAFKLMKKARLTASIVPYLFEDWDDFFVISKVIKPNDLLVLVCARKGAASYMNLLEHLPSKLEKHFEKNSRIVIYPQQFSQHFSNVRYNNITPEPLSKGIETVQKIGRGIGNIFKKDDLE